MSTIFRHESILYGDVGECSSGMCYAAWSSITSYSASPLLSRLPSSVDDADFYTFLCCLFLYAFIFFSSCFLTLQVVLWLQEEIVRVLNLIGTLGDPKPDQAARLLNQYTASVTTMIPYRCALATSTRNKKQCGTAFFAVIYTRQSP